MDLKVLKSPGFWITAVTAIIGLLVSSKVVLSGSTVDQVFGWILTIVGVVGGHQVALPKADAPAGN